MAAPAEAPLAFITFNKGSYDVNPNRFGQFSNLVTLASNFGDQTEVYNGLDVTTTARFGKGGLFQGGIGTGRTV